MAPIAWRPLKFVSDSERVYRSEARDPTFGWNLPKKGYSLKTTQEPFGFPNPKANYAGFVILHERHSPGFWKLYHELKESLSIFSAGVF